MNAERLSLLEDSKFNDKLPKPNRLTQRALMAVSAPGARNTGVCLPWGHERTEQTKKTLH
jgi:hypothetical protein